MVANLVDDADAVMAEAAAIFDEMIPNMAYVGKPRDPMAMNVFGCAAEIAVYVAASKHDVDVHEFGNALLIARENMPRREPEGPKDSRPREELFAEFVAAGDTSQGREDTGEFVFEAFLGDRQEFDWGMDITSCGVCYLAAQYDATELVPYMCATDDIVSDRDGHGLRRTGAIAVGSKQCDFRFKRGGEPQPLSAEYPDQIRIAQE
jgi:hypothetical protein